jgi:crossover junction endodeoxyribonuclease RuvC
MARLHDRARMPGRRPVGCAECLQAMIVLGIDPGTASTGYGLVCSEGSRLRALQEGVIQTGPGVPLERRLAEIHARVAELLDAHCPAAVAVEELYFGANVRTAFAVGQARGVVLLAAGQRGVPSRSYTPQQVKSAVCGHGRVDKDQVGRMVARLLGMTAIPTPDHAADALAVAICDLNRAPLALAVAAAPPAASVGSAGSAGR